MEIKGIDVSSYQKKPDWKKVKQSGVKFAILRIHQRTGIDTSFEHNYKGCCDNGILVGGYKLSYATTVAEAEKEAEETLSVLKGRKLDFPVFYDLEWETQRKFSKSKLEAIALAFLRKIHSAGYKAGIYSNVDWFNNLLTPAMRDYDCWIARYPATDNGKVVERLRPAQGIGWQYSSKGKVPGINGNVDMDVFYKDYRDSDQKGEAKVNLTKEQIIQNVRNDAVDFAVKIANDNSHGYSQAVRSLYNIANPKSFDCSSLALTAYYYALQKNGLIEQANYLKKNCSYTGNMLKMQNAGFEIVARNQTAHARMKKGDVELADNNPDGSNSHVALAIDGDNIVYARSSEGTKNTIDDSGNEIRTQPWYLYSHGWTHRLRFTGKGLSMVKNTTDSAKKPQATQPVNTAAPSYLVGSTYTLQVNSLNVRTGAGVQYHAKKWNELTANARQHAYTNGQLKKGTRVTCQGTKKIGDDIWMKIPSGWIAAYYEKKTYVQ